MNFLVIFNFDIQVSVRMWLPQRKVFKRIKISNVWNGNKTFNSYIFTDFSETVSKETLICFRNADAHEQCFLNWKKKNCLFSMPVLETILSE